MTGPKIYFTIPILGGINITQTAVSSIVVMLIICIGGYLLGRNLQKRPGTVQMMVETLVSMLYTMVEETMGKHNSYWTPYIGALFLSSAGGSLIGMTGILRTVTSDLSTTLTWAVMTSVLVWACSIKASGFFPWLKGYANPLNIVSDIAQPISMGFRHFGNIMGGGVLMSLLYSALATGSTLLIGLINSNGLAISIVVAVVGVLLHARGLKKGKTMLRIFGIICMLVGLVALLDGTSLMTGIPILDLGIPAVLSIYFDIFSAFVQALVFSLLTMVYVGSACGDPEEEAVAAE